MEGDVLEQYLKRLEDTLEIRLDDGDRMALSLAGMQVIYILSDAAYRLRWAGALTQKPSPN